MYEIIQPSARLTLFCLLLMPLQYAMQEKISRKINTDLTAIATVPTPTDEIATATILRNNANSDIAVADFHQQPSALIQGNDTGKPNIPTTVTTTTNDTHICTREETYVEQLRIPTMQPVRIRTSNWCLEFPPRCSNYRMEMREVVKVENITKTRTIRFCCAGYEGNISINDTVCKPVCRGGCGRGFCEMPDQCSCEVGYTGKHCTQRCDHDHWGPQCKNQCQCQNGAVCDNKMGMCHCTMGWTGEFCELPCPVGTYGVMCRKQCACTNSRTCHPQSGACQENDASSTALLPSANVTHVMMQTLNSTIANITHNLDRIAKNIVDIQSTTIASIHEPIGMFVVPDITTLSPLQAAPPVSKHLPEVIVIKQDEQHTPKIIVHQPGAGLLEDLHTAAAKAPEVIHVITSWQGHANATDEHHKLDLASFGTDPKAPSYPATETSSTSTSTSSSAAEHDANLLTTLLIILLIIMIAIAMSFLYIYRRYHWQKERVEAAIAARTGGRGSGVGVPITNVELGTGGGGGDTMAAGKLGLGKSYLKPLPDLPEFTQMVCNKIEAPEFYDTPSNNSSIKVSSYDYARKESMYSVVSPKARSRKGSPDSHLYDEIPYPMTMQHHQQQLHQAHNQQPTTVRTTLHHHHHHQNLQSSNPVQQHNIYVPHHHHQHQQQQHNQSQQPHQSHQLSTPVHHITHLVIPPQNSKYLQVPPPIPTHVSHKIAHM